MGQGGRGGGPGIGGQGGNGSIAGSGGSTDSPDANGTFGSIFQSPVLYTGDSQASAPKEVVSIIFGLDTFTSRTLDNSCENQLLATMPPSILMALKDALSLRIASNKSFV